MPSSSAANFLGGATSGCVSTLLLQPLDVIKTRLQVSPHSLSRAAPLQNPALSGVGVAGRPPHPGARAPGIIDTFHRIVRHDSARGLWRGVTPTLFRNTVGVGLYFVTLNKLSAVLARPDGTISDGATLVAGASARSLAVCVLCPLSVVKTRLELAEFSVRYTGVFDALRKIALTEGPRGLFSGLTPAIVRDAPYSALFVLIYLRTKEGLNAALGLPSTGGLGGVAGAGSSPSSASASAAPRRLEPPADPVPYAKAMGVGVNFVAAAFGGGLSTLLTQPQDLIKTRMQIMDHSLSAVGASGAGAQRLHDRSLLETVRAVYREAGVPGFFRGAYPRFLKRMLGSAVTWVIFTETRDFYAAMLPDRADNMLESVAGKKVPKHRAGAGTDEEKRQ